MASCLSTMLFVYLGRMSERQELVELNINVDREAFVRKGALELLDSLAEDALPLWGTMTPRHMVEHLVYITENSLGRRPVPLLVPEDKLPKYKDFLMSSKGFMRNFRFPLLPSDGLQPLQFASMDEAVGALRQVNAEYMAMLDDPSFETAPHPFYGKMNREEAVMFQFKHFTHHLMQFGLICK
jgi:oxepin-CoA hydrolase/3-oxo-5,6-dehydrosuberyl-CoA semialdehyde dehydrogenase